MGLRQYFYEIPFEDVSRIVSFVRREFFEVNIPNTTGLLVDIPHDKLEHAARKDFHYEGTAKYTYKYEGEVMNIRTPDGLNDDGLQMENHIRAFPVEHDKWECFLLAHWEPSRFEHWKEHINEVGFTWEGGIERTTAMLDKLDVEYKKDKTDNVYKNVHQGKDPYDF